MEELYRRIHPITGFSLHSPGSTYCIIADSCQKVSVQMQFDMIFYKFNEIGHLLTERICIVIMMDMYVFNM